MTLNFSPFWCGCGSAGTDSCWWCILQGFPPKPQGKLQALWYQGLIFNCCPCHILNSLTTVGMSWITSGLSVKDTPLTRVTVGRLGPELTPRDEALAVEKSSKTSPEQGQAGEGGNCPARKKRSWAPSLPCSSDVCEIQWQGSTEPERVCPLWPLVQLPQGVGV